jgi:hypothetical protein
MIQFALPRLLAFYMDHSRCYPIGPKFAVDAVSYGVANATTDEYGATWLAHASLAIQ